MPDHKTLKNGLMLTSASSRPSHTLSPASKESTYVRKAQTGKKSALLGKYSPDRWTWTKYMDRVSDNTKVQHLWFIIVLSDAQYSLKFISQKYTLQESVNLKISLGIFAMEGFTHKGDRTTIPSRAVIKRWWATRYILNNALAKQVYRRLTRHSPARAVFFHPAAPKKAFVVRSPMFNSMYLYNEKYLRICF